MSRIIVFSSENVILPNHHSPLPATIIANQSTGVITHILYRRYTEAELDHPDIDWLNGQNVEWIDAGSNFILPGLVECALSISLYLCFI
jgi:allantoinase